MSSNKLSLVTARPNRSTSTKMDTLEVSPEGAKAWKKPPFQRPLKVNDKVRGLAETIRSEGVIPGVITLGVLGADTYLLDGQHRREAFLISAAQAAFVDVRVHHFNNMGEMGEEFVILNSAISRIGPDDILRGLKEGNPALQKILSQLPFVGFDMIRRGAASPVVSMSALLRCWFGAACDVPARSTDSAPKLVERLTMDEVDLIGQFGENAYAAWGHDREYGKLWGGLNLILCMWLFRRMVLTQYSAQTPRLTRALFQKCLMEASADATYIDWLGGRSINERDRSPCFTRLRSIFAKRIERETQKRVRMPAPAWSTHSSGRGR